MNFISSIWTLALWREIGPHKGQGKTLTRVGFEPMTLRFWSLLLHQAVLQVRAERKQNVAIRDLKWKNSQKSTQIILISALHGERLVRTPWLLWFKYDERGIEADLSPVHAVPVNISLSWPVAIKNYLHIKIILFPEGCFGPPTWTPSLCFDPLIWPRWRHVKSVMCYEVARNRTVLISLLCVVFPNIVMKRRLLSNYFETLFTKEALISTSKQHTARLSQF